MAAIISGNGAGLFNSSLLGNNQGANGNSNLGQSQENAFVNAATGNLVIQRQDEIRLGVGTDTSLLRTYNSLGEFDGDKDNWLIGFNRRIELTNANTITRYTGDGYKQALTLKDGVYISEQGSGADDVLKLNNDGTYTWVEGSTGLTESYDANLNLTKVVDSSGRGASYFYSLDTNNKYRLDNVVATLSLINAQGELEQNGTETTQLNYDQTSGLLLSISVENSIDSSSSSRTYYRYDSQQRLVNVIVDMSPEDNSIVSSGTNQSGSLNTETFVITYTYDGTSTRLASIQHSNGSANASTVAVMSVEYYAQGTANQYKVHYVTDGNGNKTEYNYIGNDTEVIVGGRKNTLSFDSDQRITATKQVVGGQTIRQTYQYGVEGHGNVTQISNGLGQTTKFGYDENGNLVLRQDAVGNTTSFYYQKSDDPKLNNLLLSETHYNDMLIDIDDEAFLLPEDGNTTRYIYDPTSGQLRYVLSAEGGVTRLSYNSLGQRVSQKTYLTSLYPVDTLAKSTDLPSIALLLSWESHADTKKDEINFTTYLYDFRGQLKSQTQYEKYNSLGNVLASGQTSTTHYVYDAHGQLKSETSALGNETGSSHTTFFNYDELGRLKNTSNNDYELSHDNYDDDNNTVTTTLANGLVTTNSYAASGILLSSAQGTSQDIDALADEHYYYDNENRQIAYQDASGAISYQLYDGYGRKKFTVDNEGYVTQYNYDKGNQLTRVVQHNTQLVTTGWLNDTASDVDTLTVNALTDQIISSTSQQNILVVNEGTDRETNYYYDQAGQQRFKIDAQGYTTEYRYDGSSNLIAEIKFDQPTDVKVLVDINTGELTVSYVFAKYLHTLPYVDTITADVADRARSTVFYYNENGRLTTTVDGDKYVTTTRYNAAGQRIKQTTQAAALSQSLEDLLSSTLTQQDTAPLATITAGPTNGDLSQHWIYDGQGRLLAEVGTGGETTGYGYYQDGSLKFKKIFDQPIVNYSADTLINFNQAANTTNFSYENSSEGKIETITTHGEVTTVLTFDKVGNLVSKLVGDLETRVEAFKYDLLGRQVDALDNREYQELGEDASHTSILNALSNSSRESIFDKKGRLIESVDIDNVSTYFYYDNRGLLTHTVNANGEVSVSKFNAFGELIEQIQLAKAIPVNALASLTYEGLEIELNKSISAETNNEQTYLTNANNQKSTFNYNQRGLLINQQSANGLSTIKKYNAFGQVSTLTTDVGALDENTQRVDRFTYDNRGHLIESVLNQASILDAPGVKASKTFDAFGRLKTSTDGNRIQTVYDYVSQATFDSNGKVNNGGNEYFSAVITTKPLNGDEVAVNIALIDVQGRTVQSFDGLGNQTKYIYNDKDRTVEVLSPSGISNKSFYDEHGRLWKLIANDGSKTTYEYDENGNLWQTYINDKLVARTEYTDKNQVKFKWDGELRKTEFTYDAATGKLTQVIVDPEGLKATTEYKYNALGLTIAEIDAEDRITRYQYNNKGQLTDIVKVELDEVEPNNADLEVVLALTHFEYDKAGKKVMVIRGSDDSQAANAITSINVYDKLGRLVEEYTDPNGNNYKNTYQYDDNSNVISKTVYNVAENGTTSLEISTYRYNENNQLVVSVDPSGALTRFDYDNAGNKVAVHRYSDFIINLPLYNPDAVTQAINTQSKDWQATSEYYVYDTDARLQLHINPNGGVKAYSYSKLGRISEEVVYYKTLTASAIAAVRVGTKTAILTQLGPIKTDDKDQHTAFIYNDFGNISYRLQKLGTRAITTYSAFDNSGNLKLTRTFARNISYQTIYTEETIQQAILDKQSDVLDREVQFFYDQAGSLRFTINNHGAVKENRYNLSGQLDNTIVRSKVISATLKTAYQSELLTYQKIKNYFGNVVLENDRLTQTVYNNAGQIHQVTDANGYTESFTYYKNGLKASYTNKNGQTWDYNYNSAGLLTEEISPLATIKNSANSSSIRASLIKKMEYDAKGNLIEITEGILRQWDDLNQQYLPDNAANARTIHFVYDKAGNQTKVIESTINDDSAPDSVVSETIYNGQGQAVVNILTATEETTNYSYKLYDQAGRTLYDIDREGYLTHYGYDGLGNQTEITRYKNKYSASLTSSVELDLDSVEIFAQSQTEKRTIVNEFNALGQKISVTLPTITYAYWTPVYGGKTLVENNVGSPQTKYFYNTFGELSSTQEKIAENQGESEWATSYYFYNNLGQKTHEVDAEGYLSKWEYDGFSQVSDYFEYAMQVVDFDGSEIPETPGTGNEITGFNRHWSYKYDELGQKTIETQHQIIATNEGSTSTSKTDVTTETEYNALGSVASVSKNGNATEMAYDELGRLTTITGNEIGVLPGITAVALNLSGTINQNNVDHTRVTGFKYDAFGNVTEQRLFATNVLVNKQYQENSDDIVTTQSYNQRNQLIIEMDALGQSTRYQYDGKGNVLSSKKDYIDKPPKLAFTRTLDDKYHPEYTYVTENFYKTVEFKYQYNALGQQISTQALRHKYSFASRLATDTTHTVTTDSFTQIKYNAYGEITAKGDDAAANDVTIKYNAAGWQIAELDVLANQNVTGLKYNLAGHLVSEIKRGKGETQYEIDKLGRTQVLHQQAFSAYEKNRQGKRVLSDASQPTLRFSYDRWGNTLTSTDVHHYSTHYRYNQNNQVTRETKQNILVWNVAEAKYDNFIPVTKYFYDVNGNMVATTDAKGHSRYQFYNADGLLIKQTDAMGHSTHLGYDVFGREIARADKIYASDATAAEKTSAAQIVTTKSYSKLGQVLTEGDIYLNTAGSYTNSTNQVYKYNELGNNISKTNASGHTYHYQFDANGNVAFSESPEHAKMAFTYDAQGNLIKKDYVNFNSRGATKDNFTWNYDYFGRLVNNGSVGATNNLDGEVSSYSYYPTGHANEGLLHKITAHNGAVQTYQYYKNGLVKSIENTIVFEGNRYTESESSYRYDKAGRRVWERNYSINEIGLIVDETVSTKYDVLGRIFDVIVRNNHLVDENTHSILSRPRYDYDELGNRLSIEVENGYTGNLANILSDPPVVIADSNTQRVAKAVTGINYYQRNIPIWSAKASDIFLDPNPEDVLTYSLVELDISLDPSDPETHKLNSDLVNKFEFKYDEATDLITLIPLVAFTSPMTAHLAIIATDPSTAFAGLGFTLEVTKANKAPYVRYGKENIEIATIKAGTPFDDESSYL